MKHIINAIRVAAKKRGIKCNQIPLERFRSYAPSQNSQGVVALKQDFKFSTLDEIISLSKKTSL
ncbi:MAG: 23S rRNA (guanosine(2251)-2'-O)-methyltransferase RlmB, partial [Ignavibacteriaceae bacterium]|nr:23S rRNA (guanosine(2251)-2'-O)-methyltransferase RlmB [Ignavibacteriaceae bacterium]